MKQIVIALGTNLGNRLENLQSAINLLKGFITDIRESIIYETKALLTSGAPIEWDMPFYNMVISGSSSLDPNELLDRIKEIEIKLGRASNVKWSPRIIDIDILFIGNSIIKSDILTIPHNEMIKRAFVMLPLNTLLPKFIHPVVYKSIEEIVSYSRYDNAFIKTLVLQPKVIGIVNITTDSFSNASSVINIENSAQEALKLIDQGAYILDIGAQSTNPKSEIIEWQTELKYLMHMLELLIGEMKRINRFAKISIDSFRPEVLSKLCDKYPIDIINDVSGLQSPEIIDIAKANSAKYVLMHSKSVPAKLNDFMLFTDNLSDQLINWAKDKIDQIKSMGFSEQNIIFDPGIGFGKSASQNIEIIRSIKNFERLNIPILIGHSRKSFMSSFTCYDAKNRDIETAIIATNCADSEYLRVHDVELSVRALIANKILNC